MSAVNLPALPEPEVTSYSTDSVMRSYEHRTFSESQMTAYATAAVMADRAALAQPAYDIAGAMARIEKVGFDHRASTAEWLGVIRSELIAAIKETT